MKNIEIFTELLKIVRDASYDRTQQNLYAVFLAIENKVGPETAIAICDRISNTLCVRDIAEFSEYDYVDAIVNWRKSLDMEALKDISDDEFVQAMEYMAREKRCTYESSWSDAIRPDIMDSIEWDT